jgi:hypothetical protein
VPAFPTTPTVLGNRELRHAVALQLEKLGAEVAAQLANAQREIEARVTAAEQAEHSRLNRLANGIRTLDQCASISEVLGSLADAVAQEAERAAVLVARSDGLRGWRFVNFDTMPSDGRALMFPFDAAGVLSNVVSSGFPAMGVFTPEGGLDGVTLPRFAQTQDDRHVVVFPIPVAGQTVEVVYADNPTTEVSYDVARWPAILGVIGRYAGRVLETMTLRQAKALGTTRAQTPSSSGNA